MNETFNPRRLWEQAQATPAARLPLTYFDQIEAVCDAADFVQGTLTEGAFSVVYGESNSGKTFFVSHLALCVAAGLPFNGRRVEQGGVVYCALEGGVGFRNRVAAWRADHDTHDGPVYFAAITMPINLLDPNADTDSLIAAILEAGQRMGVKVKFVVVDTLSRAMAGGNENAPDDMGALVMNTDRIRDQTGAHVQFIHHSGKDAAKGARGHSLLRAAVDTEIEVAEIDGTRTATTVKQRELKKGDVHGFTLEVVELGNNRHGEPVTTCLVRFSEGEAYAGASLHRRRLPVQQQRALEVLADLVAQAGQSGNPATPAGVPSVPEKWWRERFYDRAMPGSDEEAKRKAFRRAADALLSAKIVGMSAGRVWVVAYQKDGT